MCRCVVLSGDVRPVKSRPGFESGTLCEVHDVSCIADADWVRRGIPSVSLRSRRLNVPDHQAQPGTSSEENNFVGIVHLRTVAGRSLGA